MTAVASARNLLREIHRRAPKDVAVCAGVGLDPWVRPHVLSRAAHEARAVAVRASREGYLITAREAWGAHYSLLALRCGVLGDLENAERFRSFAAERVAAAGVA